MRVKHFNYEATGVELNLTNDDVKIVRALAKFYLDSMAQRKSDLGYDMDSPLMTNFSKRLLSKLPSNG